MVPVATTLKSIWKIITLITQTHPSVSSFALPVIISQYIWSSRLVGPVYSRAVSHSCSIYKNIKKRQRMSLIIQKEMKQLLLKSLYLLNMCLWPTEESCLQLQQWCRIYAQSWASLLEGHTLFCPCWINFDMCSVEEDFQKPLLFISAKDTSSPWRKVSLFLSCQREKKKPNL